MTREDHEQGLGSWWGNAREYLQGVRAEFGKVTWPGRREAVGGTIGVLVVVAVITVVLGLVDMALASFVRLVLP